MLIFKTGGQTSLPHVRSISVFFFSFATLCPNFALPPLHLWLYFFSQSLALISLAFSFLFLSLTGSIFPLASSCYVFLLHLPAPLCSEPVRSLHSQHGIYMEVQEHFSRQTVSCSTWASTAWVIRMGKEIDWERETGDRVLELYLQCIITLVFRPGPAEPCFWTWPCISFIFLVFFFSLLCIFLCSSLQ